MKLVSFSGKHSNKGIPVKLKALATGLVAVAVTCFIWGAGTEAEPPEVTPEPEVVATPLPIDLEELDMLACVIYQEAGGDNCCDDCRRRVADVVLNRIKHPRFPDTMEEVLTQYCQYGRFYWTGIVWPERADTEAEAEAVNRAYRIAEEVLLGQHSEIFDEGYIWQSEYKQGGGNIYCCGIYFGK